MSGYKWLQMRKTTNINKTEGVIKMNDTQGALCIDGQWFKADCIDCTVIAPEDAERDINQLFDVDYTDAIAATIKAWQTSDAFIQASTEYTNMLKACWKTFCSFVDYPNKRTIRLSLHHRSKRVRKKNMHRIRKWIEKGRQNHGD